MRCSSASRVLPVPASERVRSVRPRQLREDGRRDPVHVAGSALEQILQAVFVLVHYERVVRHGDAGLGELGLELLVRRVGLESRGAADDIHGAAHLRLTGAAQLVGADDARDPRLAVEALHRRGVRALANLGEHRLPARESGLREGQPQRIRRPIRRLENASKRCRGLLGPALFLQHPVGDRRDRLDGETRQGAGCGRLVVVEELGGEIVVAQVAVDDVDDAEGPVAQLPQPAAAALEVHDFPTLVFVDLEPQRLVGIVRHVPALSSTLPRAS